MKLINKKNQIILIIISFIAILVCTLSLNFARTKSIFITNTVSDIAYDINPSYGYTIYIKENNIYIPYLVLTNNYENKNMVLILRKNLIGSGEIDTTRKNCWGADSYIGTKPFSEYDRYDKTKMDYYLNNNFIESFDKEVSSIICKTNIKIANNLEDDFFISRKIFLLSTSELGYFKYFNLLKLKWSYGYGGANDGKSLRYFDDSNNIATLEDEKTIIPWWTRTNGWTYYCAVGFNGELITESSTDEYYGIRPAFCIPNNTIIEKNDSIISGQTVYVIKNDR